jgi:hypothetical protein
MKHYVLNWIRSSFSFTLANLDLYFTYIKECKKFFLFRIGKITKKKRSAGK